MHSHDAGCRGDLVSVRLRDSGSSRSFPQRSDGRRARKRRLRNPRREKSLPLSFSLSVSLSFSPTTSYTAPPPLSRTPSSSPPSPPPRTFTNDRPPHLGHGLFTNKSSHLSKRLLRSCAVAWAASPDRPGRTKVRPAEAWRQCRCSWWNSPSRLHCAKLQGARKRRPKKTTLPRLNASLRNCPTPPHFRRPESNSIPFHSTLRTASFPHLFSPPLFLSPILPFTAASIPHLSRLPIPLNAAVANVVVSTWN